MTRKRLDELLARYEPRLAARFRSLMQRVKAQRTVAELEAMIEAGASGQAVADILDNVDAAAKVMASETAALDLIVGREVSAWLGEELGALIDYDATNYRAVSRLANNRAWLARWWGADQAQAIDAVIAEVGAGLVGGINPRQMATAIKDAIGLTPDRARAVANYRRALEQNSARSLRYKLRDARSDKAVKRAIAEGKPLSPERIDKMVGRYADRQVAQRAEVIARTEAIRALHEAEEESFAQAIDGGVLESTRIQQEWHAGALPRTRESHHAMRGQLRRWQEPFISGAGNELRYPCDPQAPASETIQCRCGVSRKVLPAGKVAVSSADAEREAA